jgi:hypothetical protein
MAGFDVNKTTQTERIFAEKRKKTALRWQSGSFI